MTVDLQFVFYEVEAMTESLTNSIGDSGVNAEAAARQGKVALDQGVKAARQGVKAARQGIEYASEHMNDGVDFIKAMGGSLSDYVARQPLMAVAGAFLIGYMAARMLRKVSS